MQWEARNQGCELRWMVEANKLPAGMQSEEQKVAIDLETTSQPIKKICSVPGYAQGS